MDNLTIYFGDVGVSQVIKSTVFIDENGSKHVVYHVIISGKPLCVRVYATFDDDDITECINIERWSSIKSWYLYCLDKYMCCEVVHRRDLLHLFKGL